MLVLSEQDQADLDRVQVLIHGVLDRSGSTLTLPVVSLLTQAANDVRIATSYAAAGT
ncbi:hypothetical protein [Umezawaea sp. NPDC059074]|uniref:hypothetical protein n=1 Tax=Umezawaea sp. NPDC059074 TaxID=3346716 RepID=UPI003681782A